MAVVEALILPKKSAIAICATPGLPLPPRRATLRALFSKKTQRAMSEIPKTYEPPAIEAKWYAFWEQNGCFAADPASPKPAYSIVIPPPNVTGVLTLGHVLNNTIQDILARRARMTGHEVLWLPGTDHAGIATQNVVEKTLRKEGVMKHRDDLGREALVGKIWEWKEKYGGIILKQLRALGASCDWSRTRFTMDEDYSRCVSRVFVDLYKKGLIYRGKRMVNWCPASLTALSDEEVIMKEQKGFMYHFRVEVVEEPGTFLTIATTRPETIPADTAVAVNPNDPRYTHLIGKHVYRALPLEVPKEQRRIPIIADDHVTFDFGTGVLKVTPAHDKADFEIGLRHKLPVIDVLTPDGRMTAEAGADLAGLDRFAARKKAHEILEAAGALEKAEPYVNNVGFSERADVPIEPRLSEQWFLKYPSVEQARACVVQPNESTKDTGSAGAPPAVPGASPGTSDVGRRPSHDSPATGNPTTPDASGEAPDAAGGAPALPSANARMRFFPDRWAKVYDHWLSGIQDWCISRQLWWGHRIPAWYCEACGDEHIVVARETPSACPRCGGGLRQDEDVLDTWFSSALWPFSTLGWPEQTADLKRWYPTAVLVTGFDILFFWVARMMMMGLRFTGEVPFRDVYVHGLVRDEYGAKMSKSKGNVQDPLELLAIYGTDALRFTLMSQSAMGRDIRLSTQRIEGNRAFANKIWNASRFVLMKIGEPDPDAASAVACEDAAGRWIRSRLSVAAAEVSLALTEYRFNDASSAIYRFFWNEYCDWYLELAKLSLRSEDAARRAATRRTLVEVLETALRLLHPMMPFITEELAGKLPGASGAPLVESAWPDSGVLTSDPEAEAKVERLIAVVRAVRNIRAETGVAPSREVDLLISCADDAVWRDLTDFQDEIRALARLGVLERWTAAAPPAGAAPAVVAGIELHVPLVGIVDVAATLEKTARVIEKARAELLKVEAKLGREDFIARAPEEIVEKERERAAELVAKLDVLESALGRLGGVGA